MVDRPKPAEVLRTLHHASMFVDTYRSWFVQTGASEEERQAFILAQRISRLIAFFATLVDESTYDVWLAQQAEEAKKLPPGT